MVARKWMRVIGLWIVIPSVAVSAQSVVTDEPLEFDASISHFTDLSYERLTDVGLTDVQRTYLFGGVTRKYGDLTDGQRRALEEQLNEALAKIDDDLVQSCEAEIREWLDRQIGELPESYHGADINSIRYGAVTFFRAYEIFGDQKYLDAGLARADCILARQWPKGHWPWSDYGEDFVRIQDGFNDWPFWIMLYAFKLTDDEKYFDSAKRCADVLLSLQRDGGGWPDQWTFSGGGTGHTGVRNGISLNDSATNATVEMMVTMYHLTGDEDYVRHLGRLWPFIVKANLGEGQVIGWAEQYNDDASPTRARAYEIELPYPRTLTRAVGPMLIWMYLMTGDEPMMELLRDAYQWHEHVRRRELDPAQLDAWNRMSESWTAVGRPMHYRPGWPDAWLPDGSNWGRVTAYKMIPWYPVTDEMKQKYGGLIHRSETDEGFPGNCGYLLDWGAAIRHGGQHPECSMGFSHAARGNSMSEVRRALLEHKRGGYDGLVAYYSHPVEYSADQYSQARLDAARRAIDSRHVALASDPNNQGTAELMDPVALISQKMRWYGGPVPRTSKWGTAYGTVGEYGSVAWYQWQLVYDVMLARGEISAERAARGSRGLESFAMQTNLDSWDVLGSWRMSLFERENFFDVPIGPTTEDVD